VANKIQGKVVEVTDQGDLITDIGPEQWTRAARTSETKVIVDDEHETFGLFESNHEQPPMTLIAIIDNDAPLKLHLVSDSASIMLGVKKGATVELVW
jgi:S-adenosylmethionine hydrolase